MATYHDVRELTGLSLSTISKYFNGLPIREKNRQAIEAAAKQLDFRPNALAQGLRSRRTQSVGVVLPALDNDFHLRIIAGVERTLRGAGISILVRSSGFRDADPGDPGEAIESLLSKMVDGLLIVPSVNDIEALRGIHDIPVVLIDRLVDDLDTDAVILNNEQAAAQAARLLLDHGHRRIAVIGGDDRVWTMRRRLAGFRGALRDGGVELDPELVSHSPLTVDAAYEAMRHILARRVRPSAVFTVNYELTVGAVIALMESGLRIPEDISFVGFDSADLFRLIRPPLTYISQPVELIAEEASRLMVTRLSNPHQPDAAITMKLDASLVIGGSVTRVN